MTITVNEATLRPVTVRVKRKRKGNDIEASADNFYDTTLQFLAFMILAEA